MTIRNHAIAVVVLLLPLTATAAGAQDQFGRSVAAAGSDVLVLKPRGGRGPAAVYRFRGSAGEGWTLAGELRTEAAARTGESFSASLAAGEETLLVGSGDPEGLFGAYEFTRGDAGDWFESRRVPLTGAPATDSGVGTIDLATIMRILQPPQRVVALDGRRSVVAVVGGPAALTGVRVYERDDGGNWVKEADVTPSTEMRTSDQFGSSVAVRGDVILVGAPRYAQAGAVFVFTRDASTGDWVEQVTLTPEAGGTDSAFGAAVAFDAEVALVGAPGTRSSRGAVVGFASDGTGSWNVPTRILPARRATGDLFGAALSVVGDELVVGSPGMNGFRGGAYVFTREGVGWASSQVLTSEEPESGWELGSSVGLGPDYVVTGAPGADGGMGRAAVFSRGADESYGSAQWLTAGNNLAAVTGEEVRCAEGQAAQFHCDNVDLLAYLPLSSIGAEPGESVSDAWGWTDPETRREFALIGRSGGAAIVDVTDPSEPLYIGVVPANPSGARDLKVYADHLFFTGDGAGDHGLVVFDLTRLRDVRMPPVTLEPDTKYDGIASAHNLIVDAEAGFAYPVGASGGGETCGGGLHMVDIRDPKNPTFAGCYTDTEGLIWPGRTHDGQCVIYDGPDADYQGRQICFASNETALRIVDVTEKEAPVPLAAASYPGIAYAHQGWLTDDKRYFYLDDELDELVGLADRTRTLVWDVADLDDPVLVGEYLGPDGATDHNLYVKGDRMYQANYQAGFRVIDISDPEHPVEIGFFDTTPYDGNPPGFNGAWTAYPYFESGTVVVTSMHEGLFLLRPGRPELVP